VAATLNGEISSSDSEILEDDLEYFIVSTWIPFGENRGKKLIISGEYSENFSFDIESSSKDSRHSNNNGDSGGVLL
jgi:hypothetical protein